MRRQEYQGTTTYDYHAHISTLERTPSVLGDAPRYPNLYPLFNRKTAAHHEVEKHPRFQETVEVIEFREEKPDDHGRKEEELELVDEEAVDFKAGGFIEQKHKSFELCKWKTFKAL